MCMCVCVCVPNDHIKERNDRETALEAVTGTQSNMTFGRKNVSCCVKYVMFLKGLRFFVLGHYIC